MPLDQFHYKNNKSKQIRGFIKIDDEESKDMHAALPFDSPQPQQSPV